MKIGLFGGSFNPPHYGHLKIADFSLKKLRFDKFFWLVTPQNPFKKNQQYLPQKVRIDLCNKMIGKRRMKAIDFESKLKTFETFETIKKAIRRFPSAKLYFLMGGDNLHTFHKWKRWDFIAKKVNIIIFNRGNMHKMLRTKAFLRFKPRVLWNKVFNISSTEIRQTLGAGWQKNFLK